MRKALLTALKTAAMFLILFVLGGCMMRSAEEFYSLPQASEEYVKLQEKIDEVMPDGASYSAPVSGTHRQSVQLVDINGDGTEEGLVFFRVSGEKPLKICVFETVDGEYQLVSRIEGDGTSIESIEYYDLDGDNVKEIVVGWQMSTEMRMLKVYSMRDFQAAELMAVDYSEYAMYDMTGDGYPNITVLHHDVSAGSGSAEVYSFSWSGEITSSRAALSLGLESIDRIKSGYIGGRRPALFIEGSFGGSGAITDVLAMENGNAKNVTLGDDGTSTTVRDYTVYCTDIDDDGIMDIPKTIQLSQMGENPGTFWILEWDRYDVYGKRTYTATTYHNYSDGWYYVLDDDWGQNISIRRVDAVSGARQLVFSTMLDNGEILDFLTIYTLTGENRYEWSQKEGRVTLAAQTDSIYAAEITATQWEWSLCPTENDLKSSFHLIYSEWVTGLT